MNEDTDDLAVVLGEELRRSEIEVLAADLPEQVRVAAVRCLGTRGGILDDYWDASIWVERKPGPAEEARLRATLADCVERMRRMAARHVQPLSAASKPA